MSISIEEWKRRQEGSLSKYWDHPKWKDREKLKQHQIQWFHHLVKDVYKAPYDYGEGTVVEVGSGPWGILSIIEAKERIAVDPALEDYKQRFQLTEGVQYLNSKAESIELPSEVADVVFCCNVLNHVQTPNKVLSEISRIMKKNGTLYFDCYLQPKDQLHPWVWTETELIDMLCSYFELELHKRVKGENWDMVVVICRKL